jgi:hypothetical protein
MARRRLVFLQPSRDPSPALEGLLNVEGKPASRLIHKRPHRIPPFRQRRNPPPTGRERPNQGPDDGRHHRSEVAAQKGAELALLPS